MADVEHNALTDPELHEPKGAAAATAGQVYVADGAGSGAFQGIGISYSQGFLNGNSTVTTISGTGAGNEVRVNTGGSWSDVPGLSNNFSADVNGRITYDGTKDIFALVNFTFSINQGSAAAKVYTFQVAVNGTVVPSSLMEVSTDGTNDDYVTGHSIVNLTNGDYVEIYVRNDTDTTDLTVETGTVSILAAGWQ